MGAKEAGGDIHNRQKCVKSECRSIGPFAAPSPAMRRVHFIAIGGSAMHNMAIAPAPPGVRGDRSDDEIFEPSRSRLENLGCCRLAHGLGSGSIHEAWRR